MDDKDKGEWAETAEEGVVPDDLGSDPDEAVLGRTTGSDEPATDGIDSGAGDSADATTDGGAEPPADAEPDLKDAGAAQRRQAKD